jgi:hypothetical protein
VIPISTRTSLARRQDSASGDASASGGIQSGVGAGGARATASTASSVTTTTTHTSSPRPSILDTDGGSAKSGVSTGAKAGIAVGLILLFVLASCIAFWILRRRSKSNKYKVQYADDFMEPTSGDNKERHTEFVELESIPIQPAELGTHSPRVDAGELNSTHQQPDAGHGGATTASLLQHSQVVISAVAALASSTIGRTKSASDKEVASQIGRTPSSVEKEFIPLPNLARAAASSSSLDNLASLREEQARLAERRERLEELRAIERREEELRLRIAAMEINELRHN